MPGRQPAFDARGAAADRCIARSDLAPLETLEVSVDSRAWDDPFIARRDVRGVVRATLRRPRRRRDKV
jgi:hypothetical protein